MPPAAEEAERLPPISIQPGTWSTVQAMVQQKAGRIVVVDIWSTSCAPCLKELPRLNELQQTFPDTVTCISLNVDYVGIKTKPPEYYAAKIMKALELCDAHYTNIQCATEAELLFRELKLSSIPAVYVYDRKGGLVRRFDASMLDKDSVEEEPFTYEQDVEPLVRRLVNEG